MNRAESIATLRELAAELQRNESLAADEHVQRQSQQLQVLVAHHQRHTPAFAARLRRAKLAAADVDSVAKLTQLPLLTRREIQDLGTSFYSSKIPASHEPTSHTMTSGSTGEPIKVRKSGLSQLYWGANTTRDHRWNGRDVSGRLLSIRPTIPARKETANWGFPMAALGRTGPGMGLPTSMDLGEHLQCIDEFQPNTLLVFPNVLGGLVDEWERRGNTPPSIRHIKAVGETVREELRARVLRIAGLHIEDSYSSQECGIIAIQCPQGGQYHVMSESVVVEVIDSTGRSCEPGETGRLVVTELRNLASPLIRYEIGDVAVRGGACPCGLQLPTLQKILGRDRNLLVLPDGSRRYPIIGFHEFHKVAPVLQFRFIQHTLQEIELIVHTRATLEPDQIEALTRIVQTNLGHPFDVRITHSAARLQRSAGGKFEDFVSKVTV